eukprot:4777275-Pyramimonas_sp.AAC.1
MEGTSGPSGWVGVVWWAVTVALRGPLRIGPSPFSARLPMPSNAQPGRNYRPALRVQCSEPGALQALHNLNVYSVRTRHSMTMQCVYHLIGNSA